MKTKKHRRYLEVTIKKARNGFIVETWGSAMEPAAEPQVFFEIEDVLEYLLLTYQEER